MSKPMVGIITGSKTDLLIIEKVEAQLKAFGVDYDVTVASAHRTPKKVEAYAMDYSTNLSKYWRDKRVKYYIGNGFNIFLKNIALNPLIKVENLDFIL